MRFLEVGMKMNKPGPLVSTCLALLGCGYAYAYGQGQAAEIRHGNLRLPGMATTDEKGNKVIMVDGAVAVGEVEVPGVIVYMDTESSIMATTTEVVRVRPYSKTKLTPGLPKGPPGFVGRPTVTTTTTTRQPSGAATPGPVSPPSSSSPPPPPKIHGALNLTDSNTTSVPAGVTYSPYNADGTCRSADKILDDFQRLAAQTDPAYHLARIYGVDCDQVPRVLAAADATGINLFLGIFNLDDLAGQMETLVGAVTNSSRGWAAVDTVSVGNELVNNGQATAQQVVDAVSSARGMLRSAGYTGPVVTVDTFIAVEKYPVLCDASDYCAVNIHAFFDANTPANMAGEFVARKVADVKEVLRDPNQRIVVTESGWPWQGNANGRAVPGRDNQRVAVRSILDVYGSQSPAGSLILFTAFDDGWKKAEPATFYAEQFWGMLS